MPKALENQLKRNATKKHLTGARKNAYVYGTLHRIGYRFHKKTGYSGFKHKRGKR